MPKNCCSFLLVCSISVATIANLLLIENEAPIVGLWGLVMQIVYSMHLNSIPFIKFPRLLGLCGELSTYFSLLIETKLGFILSENERSVLTRLSLQQGCIFKNVSGSTPCDSPSSRT
jgi:hypothetical protein